MTDPVIGGWETRGYASLLMLKDLMEKIRTLETDGEDGRSSHNSSFGPMDLDQQLPPQRLSSPQTTQMRKQGSYRNTIERSKEDAYLPCHYFAYIGGTSTEG